MADLGRNWKDPAVAQHFLDETRAAIPLGFEQIDVMARVIRKTRTSVGRFLDIGCGDGILGRTVSSIYPTSKGVFVDFSDVMIDALKEKLEGTSGNSEAVKTDFSKSSWLEQVSEHAPFDLIVTGFAIHHLPDKRKKELYREIFDLLNPGGLFMNLDHIKTGSPTAEVLFEEWLLGSMHERHQLSGSDKSWEDVEKEWRKRQTDNILSPVRSQIDWLNEIGFKDVDCYFQVMSLALFGALKP